MKTIYGDMEPRGYQQKIINEIKQAFIKGIRSLIVVIGCGAGKTVIAAFITKAANEKNNRVMFLVHRSELLKQTIETFDELDIDSGIVASGEKPDYEKLTQICSIQTLKNRLDLLPIPSIVFADEAHLSAAKTYLDIIEYYKSKGALIIGLSGSPSRLDGKPLTHFDHMILGPTTRELIGMGNLSKYKAYAPSTIDMSNVSLQGGDFKKAEAEQIVNKPTITGSAINEFNKLCPGGQAVVFCITVQHSKDVAAQFVMAGINAAHFDGNTPKKIRTQIIKDFKAGIIKVLTNCNLVSEGFNLPRLDAVILLRPTASLALFIQQSMRSMRPHKDKEFALILDHVNSIKTHGLPCDDREWSLSRKIKPARGGDSGPPVKTCQICFGCQKAGNILCEYCGAEFEYDPKKIEQIDGQLVLIDQDKIKRDKKRIERQEQGQCKTLQELIELGKSRGYKYPKGWAQFIYNGRK